MLNALSALFAMLSSVFRNHVALQVEILALRHQIGILQCSARKRPKLSAADRFLWALQYAWGKLAGRHKIAPNISPSKTVEGLIGGIASATVLGAGLWWITPFSVVQAGAVAFLIALTGFLGGLVMSAIKRDRGVKDWSQFIPGHGGMLDRIDSVCFSAPMFFYLTRGIFAS